MIFYISFILGIIALTTWVLSVQLKKKKDILALQTIANIFYALQYLCLGALSAFSMNILSIIRGFTYYYYEKDKKDIPLICFIVICFLIILIGFFTYNGLLSLIPIILSIFYAYSLFQKNIFIFRLIFILAAIVWLYYNFNVGAYVSLVGNCLEIVSGVTALIRNKK